MTLNDAAFLVLVLLTFADLGTTVAALDLHAKESNPFLAWLFGQLGVEAALLPLKWAIIGAVGYFRYQGQVSTAMLAAFCLLYGVIVVNNLRVLKKQK